MAGPIKPDMELQREVRRLTLRKIKSILEADNDDEFTKAVILKLAGTVLPRINEVTGEDGGPMIFQITKEIAEKNGIIDSTSSSEANS
jgi:hypothetical protein